MVSNLNMLALVKAAYFSKGQKSTVLSLSREKVTLQQFLIYIGKKTLKQAVQTRSQLYAYLGVKVDLVQLRECSTYIHDPTLMFFLTEEVEWRKHIENKQLVLRMIYPFCH